MLGFPMAKNKNVGELETNSTIESIEGLVRYFVNLGYEKCIEQFVTPKFYNELKLEYVGIKVTKFLVVMCCLSFHLHNCYTNKENCPYVRLHPPTMKKQRY
jgi:hypothetical protein